MESLKMHTDLKILSTKMTYIIYLLPVRCRAVHTPGRFKDFFSSQTFFRFKLGLWLYPFKYLAGFISRVSATQIQAKPIVALFCIDNSFQLIKLRNKKHSFIIFGTCVLFRCPCCQFGPMDGITHVCYPAIHTFCFFFLFKHHNKCMIFCLRKSKPEIYVIFSKDKPICCPFP